MSGQFVSLRYRPYGAGLGAIVIALLALAFAVTPSRAADATTLAQLNQQVAATLRSDAQMPHRNPIARAHTPGSGFIQTAGVAGPIGRHFVLPAWIAPFARIDRLMHVHAGALEFDGWGALRPGGAVRLQFTLRV